MSKNVESERDPGENGAHKQVIDINTGGGDVEVTVISYGDGEGGTKENKGEEGGDQTKEAHGSSRVRMLMLDRFFKEWSDVCALFTTQTGSLEPFICALPPR